MRPILPDGNWGRSEKKMCPRRAWAKIRVPTLELGKEMKVSPFELGQFTAFPQGKNMVTQFGDFF
jgi:hypothetical protein